MSANFKLIKKGEDKPMTLDKVDEELCKVLGVPVHPKHYVCNWFDTIGWYIASNPNMDSISSDSLYNFIKEKIKVHDNFREKMVILNHLHINFESENWFGW